jgi:hypothetical protein
VGGNTTSGLRKPSDALEGELAQLETAWKEAEELASIADGLGVSARLERAFRTLRGQFG